MILPVSLPIRDGGLAHATTYRSSRFRRVSRDHPVVCRAETRGPGARFQRPGIAWRQRFIEAHDFAAATDTYRALGATVIGVSHDNIDTLNKFSVSECRSKFAVAADTDQKIMKSYDAVLAAKPEYADRVSYVIAPDGHIIYAYQSLNPEKHVANTLEALRKWTATRQ